MMSEQSLLSPGFVKITATSGRGLSPEELTEMTIDKIISISESSHPLIKQQAEAFRDSLKAVLTKAFYNAQKSERTTLYNLFMNQGHTDMAEIIKRL
jgi:hypothetical protein